MKRSFINTQLAKAIEFCRQQNFHLPKWAYWTSEDWSAAGHEADEIRQRLLGWDVTDFGKGQFDRFGLICFTLRNGELGDNPGPTTKTYCEKLLLVDEGQETPTHFHWSKMEDIINRSGGNLVLQLWNADRLTELLDEGTDVSVRTDGIEHTIRAGGTVVLEPGESITLAPYLYHNFVAEVGAGRVLAGEVSRVNDDVNDNRFLSDLPRFPTLEEDAQPLHLLCSEYPPAKE